MPRMLTAASDSYDRRSCEYHELSHDLQQLAEAAAALRGAWTVLDTLETTARREGRHDTAHGVRSPEQSAYIAWQAAELTFRQVRERDRVRVEEHQGDVVASWEPEPAVLPDGHGDAANPGSDPESEFWADVQPGETPDHAVVFSWDAKSERDRAEALAETEFWAGVEAGRQFPR